MPQTTLVIVFVHGWSVTDINTYGLLPFRLQDELEAKHKIKVDSRDIFLGEYISFDDHVRMRDIVRAFNSAVKHKLDDILSRGHRFICITHSTGGPVVREWWDRYYKEKHSDNNQNSVCPMSHLIMLAPANFGSALAKLGKTDIGRLRAQLQGIPPGEKVLEWLALGSNESWDLNQSWIYLDDAHIGPNSFFPFVITGDYIDRKLYNHAVPYTGEIGSDGVVRAAAANLNGRHLLIEQTAKLNAGNLLIDGFTININQTAPQTAFLIVPKRSHSGKFMGIMESVLDVSDNPADKANQPTIDAIIECILTKDKESYNKLSGAFRERTEIVQQERLEIVDWRDWLRTLTRQYYIHDKYCMVIIRVRDTEGLPVPVYDAIFTSGPESSADYFPKGFMGEKQKNKQSPETITFYFNYDILQGPPEVKDGDKKIREKGPGIEDIGLTIYPYPVEGFIRYKSLRIPASKELYAKLIKENSTVLVDIVLQRLVGKETFELNELPNTIKKDFKNKLSSDNAVE